MALQKLINGKTRMLYPNHPIYTKMSNFQFLEQSPIILSNFMRLRFGWEHIDYNFVVFSFIFRYGDFCMLKINVHSGDESVMAVWVTHFHSLSAFY